jgi:hypothetical protein
MALVFRRFRARPSREAAVLEHLRTAACRIVEEHPGSVVIFRTGEPREMVWLGNEPPGVTVGCDDSLAECFPDFSLQFVDGWYRLPAPPHEIWNLEVRTAGEPRLETLKRLLELSRWHEEQPHVVGRSVFRVIEDPSAFIGFVGMTRGWSRDHAMSERGLLVKIGGSFVWRPLFLVYKVEATPGGPVRISGGEGLTLPAFWAAAGCGHDLSRVTASGADRLVRAKCPPASS